MNWNIMNTVTTIKATLGENEQMIQEYKHTKSLLLRNKIVERNLRLITLVLKQFRPFTDDQFQAGCLGLIRSVDSYKIGMLSKKGKPIAFSTFAVYCIKSEIMRLFLKESNYIENKLKSSMVYLDKLIATDEDSEATYHDFVKSEEAEEELLQLMNEMEMEDIYENIIIPSVKGTDHDEEWQKMEISYLIFLIFGLNKITLKFIGEKCNTTTQCMLNRHKRTVNRIQSKYKIWKQRIEESEKNREVS